MIIPKHPWTKEQVKAVWPVWVWMPDEMREELQDKVQSETNPNGEWPILIRNSKVERCTRL